MHNAYKKTSVVRSESVKANEAAPGTPPQPTTRKMAVEGDLKLLETFVLPKEVMSCRFNPSGDLLAVGLSNGVIKIFSVDSKTCVYSMTNPNSELPVTCLRWKPDTDDQAYAYVLTATYASGDVKQWHVSSGKCLWSLQEDRQVLTSAISYTAERFLTSGSDAKVNMYDAATRRLLNTFEASTKYQFMDGHTMRVFVVQFQPNSQNVFVSGGWDDTVQWWDVRQDPSHNIRKIVGPHICGEGLDIEPTSLNIVTGSWRKDNNIQVWDFHSGNLVRDVPSDFNRSMIYSVQWKNSDTIIAGGSHCNMMRFINYKSLSTTARLMDLPGAVYTVDNNRKGPQPVVSVGCADTIYLVQEISKPSWIVKIQPPSAWFLNPRRNAYRISYHSELIMNQLLPLRRS